VLRGELPLLEVNSPSRRISSRENLIVVRCPDEFEMHIDGIGRSTGARDCLVSLTETMLRNLPSDGWVG